MSAGLTGTYSTTLIHAMGFNNRQSALLNMPTGCVGILCNLTVGLGIRRTSNRWAWAVGLTFPGVTGAALLAFTPQTAHIAQLLGLYMVVAIYSITTVVQQWAMANVSGHTKRSAMAATMSACYGIGAIIAPQTFQEKDKENGYLPAKVTVMATQATCMILFVMLRQYYVWENARRDMLHHEEALEDDTGVQLTTEESWAGLTDRQNKRFRYIY
jgi:predicted MFS family arabinose efflux permease